MSEYDSSPATMVALKANKHKCANWATKTAGYAEDFTVPFGTRSDVDNSEFYKLKPGEEDEIECGSMGVPEHERMAMEASVGMHSHRRAHGHPAPHQIYGQVPPPPMIHHRSYPGPPAIPGPPIILESPPPSAGFSRSKRFSSRAAPPPSLQLPMGISTSRSPHPSAGSQPHFSALPFHRSTHPTPSMIHAPSFHVSPPESPTSHDGHHSHNSHSHSHSHSHRDGHHHHHHHKSEKHRSRSSSRPSSAAAYIYSPPVTPGSESPSPLGHPAYGGRTPSVVYMPAGSIPSGVHHNLMTPVMRYAAAAY